MPKYKANRDLWLSHENRLVKEGEIFETTFPKGPGGKPMVLGESLELVKNGRDDKTGEGNSPQTDLSKPPGAGGPNDSDEGKEGSQE